MSGNDDKNSVPKEGQSLQQRPQYQTYDTLQHLVKITKLSDQLQFNHLPLKKRILLHLAERKYHHTFSSSSSSDSDSGGSEATSIESEKDEKIQKNDLDETMSSSSGTSSINNFSPPSQSTPTIVQRERPKFATPEIKPLKQPRMHKPTHTSPLLNSPVSSNDIMPDKVKKVDQEKKSSSEFLIPQRPIKDKFRSNEYLKSRMSPVVLKHEKKTKKKRKSSDDADKIARKQAKLEKKEQKKRAAKNPEKMANSVTGVEHIVETDTGLAYHIDKDDPSNESITCFCAKPFAGRMMIECDFCQIWYHVDCVKLDSKELPDEYYCVRSEKCHQAKKLKFRDSLKL